MKCLLISRFNVKNIGDLLIADQLYQNLKKSCKVDRYNLYGHPYRFTDFNHVIPHPDRFIKRMRLHHLLTRFKLTFIEHFARRLFYRLSRKSTNQEAFVDTVARYDAVIIGGGNMIFELTEQSHTIPLFEHYVTTAKKAKKPVYVLSIGLGPFHTHEQEKSAIKALNACDKITFRDQASLDLFLTLGGEPHKAKQSIDPVFLYPLYVQASQTEATAESNVVNQVSRDHSSDMNHSIEKKSTKNKSMKHIGLNILDPNILPLTKQTKKDIMNGYQQLIKELLVDDTFFVHVFTTTKEDDLALLSIKKHYQSNNRVIVHDVNSVSQLLKIYQTIDVLIGTRMHSLILSFTQKVPFIGLTWQQKVDALFKQLEITDYVYRYDAFHIETDKIAKQVNELLTRSTPFVDSRIVKEMSERHQVDLELINHLT